MDTNRYRIGKTYILITNGPDTKERILEAVDNKANGYVCVSNMRTVALADKDPAYRQVMSESLFNIPDGTPLVWCARLWGLKNAQRSSGPDLFVKMLTDKGSGLKHFLLGDTDETLSKLIDKFGPENIAGTYSPPFKPIEEYDIEGMAKMISDSGANIVWTSLRAPKQDVLAHKLSQFTDNVIFVGVAAAFRVALGEMKMPPEWARRSGLTGIWLLRNSVGKELIWYIKHSYHLARFATSILYKRMRGHKYYE